MAGQIGDIANLLEQAIANHSPDAADRFRRLFKHYASRHQGHSEIELLNRFWATQLGVLAVNTISEREWLVNDVNAHTWVMFFEKNILATVLREQLPKSL